MIFSPTISKSSSWAKNINNIPKTIEADNPESP